MRKAFRTTLDEDILCRLKSMAANQGVHVNNIIENLVMDKIYDEYFTQYQKRECTLAEKRVFWERRMTQVIRNCILEFGEEEKPANLSEIMSKAIVDLLISDQVLFLKKK